jgi:hypothetical protein
MKGEESKGLEYWAQELNVKHYYYVCTIATDLLEQRLDSR